MILHSMTKVLIMIIGMAVSIPFFSSAQSNRDCLLLKSKLPETAWKSSLWFDASIRSKYDSTIFHSASKVHKNLVHFDLEKIPAKRIIQDWTVYPDPRTNLIVVKVNRLIYNKCDIIDNEIELTGILQSTKYYYRINK